MSKPTLFLSFTSLLSLVKEGKVTQGELGKGLFYLGCTRNYVFNPFGHSNVVVIANTGEDDRALDAVQAAVVRAEVEGRVVFRHDKFEQTSYALLCELLERNGLSLSLFVGGSIPKGVAEAMEVANIDLDDIKDATTLKDIAAILDTTHFFQFSKPIAMMLFSHVADIRS